MEKEQTAPERIEKLRASSKPPEKRLENLRTGSKPLERE